jgi:hypothetical protein
VKTHFYPFTGQELPVPLSALLTLGVPASVIEALARPGVVRAPKESSAKEGARD